VANYPMRQRRSAAVWLLLLALLVATAPVYADAPFLWSLRQGTVTHYLQGSIHLLPESALPLPAALDAAFDNTDALVLEADISALSAPEHQLMLMSAARSATGGLRATLPPALYERLRQRAQHVGLPLSLCEPFKAWFCALSLEIFTYQQAGFSSAFGLDPHYHARALAQGKTVAALESVETHLNLFVTMPEAMAQQMLEQSLDDHATAASEPQALYRSWRNNDRSALERLVAEMRRDYPEIHRRLLAVRNRAWLPQLAKRLRGSQPQLIMVGAAHLVGDDGLIALLAAEGLHLQPVADAAP